MTATVPRETRVVIVGGGIAGCSLAYHLAALGWKDVVVLEQAALAGGTTWHAAGLVGQLRPTTNMTRINKYSVELYSQLESLTGVNVGWNRVGSLIAAKSADRLVQLKRLCAMSELFGVHAEIISAADAGKKWPPMRTDDLLGAAWLPGDGKVIPKDVALALAAGARKGGVTIVEGVQVQGLEHSGGQVTGVRTSTGVIKAEYVALCGGMWMREFGAAAGVALPLYPVEHHYVVTGPLEGASDDLPVGRDPDLCIYFRGEGQGIVLGAFQARSKAWDVPKIPDPFSFRLLEPDWDRYAEPLANGSWRIPAFGRQKVEKFVNGPESFTPDNNFLMGETPELRNLYVLCGFNSVGIASAGGAGKYLAEWIAAGEAPMDLWSVDVRRFGSAFVSPRFLQERAEEVLGLHYQMAWPNREMETGRNLKTSPLHDRLASRGACFGIKNGWERPNWFARDGAKPVVEYSFGRQNWFNCQRREHLACRESVAVFDQTGFSKFTLTGPDACAVLQRLCGNDVDVPPGRTVYTGMFNARGTFESDLTVLRVGPEAYYIVTGAAQAVRDCDWINRNLRPGECALLTDVTNEWSVLGVMGPKSRALLSRLTDADISNAGFPFGAGRTIPVAGVAVRALRITYVGELGWELHVPATHAGSVYDALHAAGGDLGLVDAGHYTINSLRLEKGYRAWGSDLTPDFTPLEAGLAFAVGWKKSVPFNGREALEKQRGTRLPRMLVGFTLNDPGPVLWGNEPILRDGVPVGYTTSGSYGHTLGAAIGMGYVTEAGGVDAAWVKAGTFEINVSGDRVPATAHLRPPYDPDRTRISS